MAPVGCEATPSGTERTSVISRLPRVTSVTIDDESELGVACPSLLDACGSSLTPSCRVSCQPMAAGCADVWELYRLNVLPPNFRGEWLRFDAEGTYGIFALFPIPAECPLPSACGTTEDDVTAPEYFAWSAADGVVALSSAVGADAWLTLDRVSDDASVAFGRMGRDSVYWTRAAGLQPVPLKNAAMARNGRLFAGLWEGGGARWAPESGVTDTVQLESPLAAQAEGDAALFVSARTIVYSPAAGESTSIALPLDTSPARFEHAGLAAGSKSFAATLSDGDDVHLYRWADGMFERIELPPRVPAFWSIDPRISDDGRVILAVISSQAAGQPPQQQIVRWSAETGMQLLSEDPTFSLEFVSVAGDVIIGRVEAGDGRMLVLRWSLHDGMQETAASQVSNRVAFDGDVLVDMDDDGILVHKYDGSTDVPLPLDHLRGRLVPQRPFWMMPQRISPDARILGGTATDDPGNDWLWVARLQTVCLNAP